MAMSEKDKKMLFIALPFLVAGALFWFGYQAEDSWWNTYDKWGREIEEKDKKLHEAMEQEKNLDALKNEVEQMQKELEIADRLLPKENDVQGLLTKIPELAVQAGVPKSAITSINFSGQNMHETYKEWPIALQFKELTFAQMVDMLNRFDNFERLLDVVNLPLAMKSADDNTIELVFKINVYVFKEQAPEGETPEGGENKP
ncbi:MAG TPA: type 4a pilus biogenesis protein PilO [bacterium]|nr:type 4a pilus biogenesis protein PilO [bacterium]